MQRLRFVEERRLDQDEDAERDAVRFQEGGGAGKLFERHLLVEFRQHLRMRRLQAHRHFQFGVGDGTTIATVEQITKADAGIAHESWVAFDNHSFECRGALSDRAVVLDRNGARIKKTAAVVQFDLPGRATVRASRDILESVIDLRRNRPGFHSFR